MGFDLQQILRSFCCDSEWKYAVFWKLKHRARMVLTWEDAYYDCGQHDSSENKFFRKNLDQCHDRHYSNDPLGLAVANMSYQVYSLGEGIVGQVAVTGKYRWITADVVTRSSSLLEYCDGWKIQFSAGIETIVVVGVVPYGVVQLGSLNKVAEDASLVTHIRGVFSTLQELSVEKIPCMIPHMKSSLIVPDTHSKGLASEIIPDCLNNLDKELIEERGGTINDNPMLGFNHKNVEVVIKQAGIERSMLDGDGSAKLLHSKSNVGNLEHLKLLTQKFPDERCVEDTGAFKEMGAGSKPNGIVPLHDSSMNVINLYNNLLQPDNIGDHFTYFPLDPLKSAVYDRVKLSPSEFYPNQVPQTTSFKGEKLKKDIDIENNASAMDLSDISLKFPADSELHKVLGPVFFKTVDNSEWKAEKTDDGILPEMPKDISCSQLTSDSYAEHLLEAIVANVCYGGGDIKAERSLCRSTESLLTTEKGAELSTHGTPTVLSGGYSINQSTIIGEDTQGLSSSGIMYPKGFSSTYSDTGGAHSVSSSGPEKNNKKRARPGESCRPRPRDRQLIQDRIKELRELVPCAAKCSIDSLLERTMKHLLFLQGITKHTAKLAKCSDVKLHQKETCTLGPSDNQQRTSWAVEVGGHLKVCSIIVENLNKSGQILVEMLCEECSYFLEIAEAIRSLGLTILKGVTEVHGEKMWIYFVVEGQDNKNVHRMDILWSLVQMLQPRTAL